MRHTPRTLFNPDQLCLFAEHEHPIPITMRARCLTVINSTPCWLSAADISYESGLSYRQTVDALNALYNFAYIARQGRKFTARWGSLRLASQANTPQTRAVAHLEAFFRQAHT